MKVQSNRKLRRNAALKLIATLVLLALLWGSLSSGLDLGPLAAANYVSGIILLAFSAMSDALRLLWRWLNA